MKTELSVVVSKWSVGSRGGAVFRVGWQGPFGALTMATVVERRYRMAQNPIGLPEIKGNQGKSSPRAGSFFENLAGQKVGCTKVAKVGSPPSGSFLLQVRRIAGAAMLRLEMSWAFSYRSASAFAALRRDKPHPSATPG